MLGCIINRIRKRGGERLKNKVEKKYSDNGYSGQKKKKHQQTELVCNISLVIQDVYSVQKFEGLVIKSVD